MKRLTHDKSNDTYKWNLFFTNVWIRSFLNILIYKDMTYLGQKSWLPNRFTIGIVLSFIGNKIFICMNKPSIILLLCNTASQEILRWSLMPRVFQKRISCSHDAHSVRFLKEASSILGFHRIANRIKGSPL